MRNALTEAIIIRDKDTALQSEANAAEDALRTAIANLKEKTELRAFNSETLAKNAKANSEQWPLDQWSNTDGKAAWAFDDEDHWWHSRYSGSSADGEVQDGKPSASNPIWIQTGFGKTWYVDSIDVTGRGLGQIDKYEIQVANTDKTKDQVTDEDFTVVKIGNLVNNEN